MRYYLSISLYNFLVNSFSESSLKLIQCCFQIGLDVNLDDSKTNTFSAVPPIPITLTGVFSTLYSPFNVLLFLIFSIILSISSNLTYVFEYGLITISKCMSYFLFIANKINEVK